ncbi:MAG: FlgD immunoglobulin-like domain containing protein [Candidatus Zixiibacteriota bacterium]
MSRKIIMALIITSILVFGALLFAQRHGPRHPFMDELTESQRTEIREMVQSMREDDASREEIREAVHARLESWGIEVPEEGCGPRHRHMPFMDELDESQRTEIREMVQSMREDAREEICEAVHSRLESWGIEVPEEGCSTHMRHKCSKKGFGDSKRAEICEGKHAGHESCCDEVREEDCSPRSCHKSRHMPFMSKLDESQRTEIREMVYSMREDDASREDIREAVYAKLESWGIEVPETPEFLEKLNRQQKREIFRMTRTMKHDGASKEEIRIAIKEKLQEWGIDFPEKQNFPEQGKANRFNSSVSPSPAKQASTVEYDLDKADYTEIKVYDTNGKLIKALYSGDQKEGRHSVRWDGKNSSGEDMPNGAYLVKISSGNHSETQKIILMK